MLECLNFSVVKFHQRRIHAMFKNCGLESKLVDLEEGTIMNCWIPQKATEGVSQTTSKKPLVLIHAYASSSNAWHYQVKEFSKVFDLYIPDLVFFGESTTTRTDRSEFFQAECVAKTLEQLSVPKYSVLGTSYGGFVAYRIAHLYPDSVDKVVISSSGVIMDPSSNQELLDKYNCKEITDIILPTTVDAMRRMVAMAVHKQPWFGAPGFLLQDYLNVVILEHYQERKEIADCVVLGKDDSPPLPTVPQDCLIIWGEFDEVFKLKLAYQLKEHVGEKAKVVVIKNSAHCPQVEQASEYNEQIIAYLTGAVEK